MKKFLFALLLGASFSLMSFTSPFSNTQLDEPEWLVIVDRAGRIVAVYADGCSAGTIVNIDTGSVWNEEGPC